MSRNKQELVHINVLLEFFETAIHQILYMRDVYPVEIFERRQKYGVVVYQSIHPMVNEYIAKCMKAVKFHATNKHLSKLYVCLSSSRVVIEKYVFDLLNLSENFDNDSFLVRLEQNLRTLCLKIHTCHTFLAPLPDDTVFTIQLLTTEYSSVSLNKSPEFDDFPWMQISPKDSAIDSSDVIPLHTVESDILSIQVYIEKEQYNKRKRDT